MGDIKVKIYERVKLEPKFDPHFAAFSVAAAGCLYPRVQAGTFAASETAITMPKPSIQSDL